MDEPTSSPSKGDREIGEAINHLIQGKRHLLVQDYVSAVESLQEACQLYSQKYGESADECGEPYFYYGKALLELARMETGVLGNALEGVPNDDDGSGSDEDSQVESPENVSEEEREQIKRDVDAAIDENSRDLEEKMKQRQDEINSSDQSIKESTSEMKMKATNTSLELEKMKEGVEDGKEEAIEVTSASNDAGETNKKMEGVAEDEPNDDAKCDDTTGKMEGGVTKTAIMQESNDSGETNEKTEGSTKEEPKDDAKCNDTTSKMEGGIAKAAENQKNENVEIVSDNLETDAKITETPMVVDGVQNANDIGDESGKTEDSVEDSKIETQPDVTSTGEAIGTKNGATEVANNGEIQEEMEAEVTKKEQDTKTEDKSVVVAMETEAVGNAEGDSKTTEANDKDSATTVGAENASSESQADEKEGGNADAGNAGSESKVASASNCINESMDESMEEDEEENQETNAEEGGTVNSEVGAAELGEKEEEISNLQLAWEILELAKLIFKRQAETDKKMELKAAETLLKLGEIGIESENYKQAIDDLSECLALQKQHLTPDDRAIAETFYQLGLAYSFFGQYDDSIDNFHKSMSVIDERIANLQQSIADGMGKTASDSCMEDPLEAAKREMEDLKGILPDIKSKIEDTEDMMRNSAAALKEAALQRLQGEMGTSWSDLGESSSKDEASPKPAMNITHLLKRKRKSEESVDTIVDADAKKKRPASGDKVSNGMSNGQIPLITSGENSEVST